MGSGANSLKHTFLIVQLIFLSIYSLIGYGTADWFIKVNPDGINIPNKEYWLFPSRMELTLNNASAMVYWILFFTNITTVKRIPAKSGN